MCSLCGSYGSVLLDWSYLAVQLLVQLTDALSQICKLLCNDSMVDRLSCICLHIKVLWHKITVALWKNKKHRHYKIFLNLHQVVAGHKKTKTTYSPFIYIFSCYSWSEWSGGWGNPRGHWAHCLIHWKTQINMRILDLYSSPLRLLSFDIQCKIKRATITVDVEVGSVYCTIVRN